MTTERKKLPALRIGDISVNPPIIQGGMGVRVSRSGLAAAVANAGCIGIIASVCLGDFEHLPPKEFVHVNQQALRDEIRTARANSKGYIGVNVMVALTNYDSLVTAAVEEGVDLIISGAGLPFELPKFAEGSNVKLVPIVSSARALNLICQKWKRRFDRLPDAVVVEGPLAGGHLGFAFDDVVNGKARPLEEIIVEVIETAKEFSPDNPIPVIAAGGVFDGADIVKYIRLGASGVQMGTRFVCTIECDVHDNFKQAYIKATKPDDITIVRSPVGMPGRVFRNEFVGKVKHGDTTEKYCTFKCLKTCNPKAIPYCISKVLANAAAGNLDEGFVFTGANGYRCTEIIPVQTLVDKLVAEADIALNG